MRRRRTTASIPSESSESNFPPLAGETPPPPAEPTVLESPAAISAPGASDIVNAGAEPATALEEPTRRRRTPRKKADTETAAPDVAPVAAAPESEPKTRRTRRPATIVAAAEPEAVAPTEPTAVETDAKPRRPRRRRQSETPENVEAIAAQTAPTDTVSPADATTNNPVNNVEVIDAPAALIEVSATVPAASPTARRVRGLRRTETAAPTILPPPTPPVAIPVVPPAMVPPVAAPSRRVRGIRAARTVTPTVDAPKTVVISVGAVSVPTAPPEPVPPVYQPLSPDILARLPETRIVPRKGIAELIINGETRTPLWFFVNTEDLDAREIARREIRLAYDAGIRLFTVLAHLPWRTRSGDRRYEPLDEVLQFVADNAPEGFILPRLIFSPPSSWERGYPGEMARYADGEPGDVSIASTLFWRNEADDALRAAVEHIAQGSHAHRVLGFYLEHGEWFYDKGRGYDLSTPNVTAFRGWLRIRYKSNLVALRSAWHDGEVSFENAAIPAYPPPAGASLFYTDREQRYVDYNEYSSDIVARTIILLGESVKEASGGRSAVAVSYGYTLELPRAASGHLALATLLASPAVDILTGPISYQGRAPGGSAPLPALVDSVLLAGKLWISEDDTKTFLASDDTPDSYNPKIAQPDGTSAVHLRNFGAALARGTGFAWMDLWGRGWLDNREMWGGIERLRNLWETLATRRRNPRTCPVADPDVAVIVDERSFFGVRNDEELLSRLICGQRDILIRSGARIGYYLLSDLTRRNFPDVRLMLFLNAFNLSEPVRAAIRERQDNGRTMAWLYAPGSRDTTPTEVADVIGMQLRLQPWGSRVGTQIIEGRSPLTDGMRGGKFGEESRTNPSYYVTDTRAQILGEYSNGNGSLAVRKHPRWQSVFVGESVLPLPLLRGLYRLAGVPSYTVDDDVAWVGDSTICLHSAPGGGTAVYLQEDAVLFDLLSGETVASGGRGARLSMPPRGTRLLFYGTPAEVTRLGGYPQAGPPGLSESEIPALPLPFHFEEPAMQTGAASVEDEELMAAALAGEIDVVDKDGDADSDDLDLDTAAVEIAVETTVVATTITDPEAAADSILTSAKKKRRRRRRGRGRTEEMDTDTPETEDGEEGDYTEGDVEMTILNETLTALPTPPGPRGRLSLEELLPLSEVLDDALLPLTEGETALDPDEMSITAEVSFQRRGRLRPRRLRRGGDVETLQREATLLEPPLPTPLPDENLVGEVESSDDLTDTDDGEGTSTAETEMSRTEVAVEPAPFEPTEEAVSPYRLDNPPAEFQEEAAEMNTSVVPDQPFVSEDLTESGDAGQTTEVSVTLSADSPSRVSPAPEAEIPTPMTDEEDNRILVS